jgi:hypothetical protein
VSKPKWKQVYQKLVNDNLTVAAQFDENGNLGYFVTETLAPVNPRTVRKLIEDGLIVPVSEFAGVAQQYEAAA